MSLRLAWVRDEPSFLALAPDWDALVEPGAPFLRHGWFASWWRAYGGGRDLAVATAWDGNRLIGGFPAVRGRGTLEAMANVHSPWFRPLAVDDAVQDALLDEVVEAAPSLHVDALARDVVGPLARRHGRLVAVDDRHVSPIVDTTGGWDAYWKSGKGRLGETARRRRKLHRERSVEEHLVVEPDDLDALLDEGLGLEASGWKGRRGTAMLSDPTTSRFYRDVAEVFVEGGLLRLSYLRVDGAMVAFDMAVLDGGCYHLLKTAYDEGLRSMAPGMTLRLAVVERCFDLGVTHDFLGDDMPYKRVFSNAERRHVAVRAYARRPDALARWWWRRQLRPVLRGVRRRLRG